MPLTMLRVFLLAVTGTLVGCQSVGSVTLTRDRLDYSNAIAESWKHQTLLNIVKLRYSDTPLFVDIGQIVGGYTLETSMNLGINSGNSRSQNLGGSSRFTDRPTITYTPLTGSAFITGMVTPISPTSLLSTIQVGWPADAILPIGIADINGIVNEDFVSGRYRPADPRFFRIVELIVHLQATGFLSFQIVQSSENTATLLSMRQPDEDSMAAIAELRNLLGLDADSDLIGIEYGDSVADGSTIALKTRSILNILSLMSAHAELPVEHVAAGRASLGASPVTGGSLRGFRIQSTDQEPTDAFVAIDYRDTWFYIDDTDLNSKRMFSLLMLLFTFAETGPERAGPILTIPTG